MKWAENIQRWRQLSPEEKHRVRWNLIPRQVALSMAFEREEVDLSWLEELHRKEALVTSKPAKGS